MPDPATAQALTAVVSELSDTGKNLLQRILGPAADEIGFYLAERIRGHLNQNRTTIINKAAELVKESRRAAQAVPLRTALPILQGAAMEDNPDLQNRWAALLANAAVMSGSVPPYYAHLLSQITPLGARALAAISEATRPPVDDRSVQQPDKNSPFYGWQRDGITAHEMFRHLVKSDGTGDSEAAVLLSIDMLVSLGLVVRGKRERRGLFSEDYTEVEPELQITRTGKHFVVALSTPVAENGV